jgi:hypothetical protein
VYDDERASYKGCVEDFLGIVLPLTYHIANTIELSNTVGSSKECADLIGCWVAADFFGTLDIIIPFCANEPLNCAYDSPLLSPRFNQILGL